MSSGFLTAGATQHMTTCDILKTAVYLVRRCPYPDVRSRSHPHPHHARRRHLCSWHSLPCQLCSLPCRQVRSRRCAHPC
ncbi:hypothetical protein C8Q74DRAFT_920389 [Fomes fomentarius]|nr:hypothetical protein C8Q74DRAFT_920389 [Fomes fomentarius]